MPACDCSYCAAVQEEEPTASVPSVAAIIIAISVLALLTVGWAVLLTR